MKQLTLQDVLNRFRAVHGDRYDYSEVEYLAQLLPVKIICKVHGPFNQVVVAHTKGHGCPACANRPIMDREKFIRRAKAKYGHKFTYDKTVYVNMRTTCIITCIEHGDFDTTPGAHLRYIGGCDKCARIYSGNLRRKDTALFIAKARKVHGDKYIYDEVEYIEAIRAVKIICPKHGVFEQIPYNHTNLGCGCPKCSNQSSKPELEVLEYLQSILPDKTILSRDKKAIGRELDIYIPEIKFAVEYCGLFWHSTMKHTKEPAVWAAEAMRGKHMDKYLACQSAGIQLVTIFGDEWTETPEKVKNALRTLVGLADKKMGARQLNVVQIPFKEAHKFYEAFHLQGAPNHGETYALVDKGGIIHSAMTFSQLSSGRDKMAEGEWELTRFSSGNTRIQGGASKLYRAFLRDKNPTKVISYSDNRWFTGKMYEQLGFKLDSLVPTDYSVVLPGCVERRHKSYAQRRNIPALLERYKREDTFDPKTDSRTELEVTHANGFGRIYDCGKKKWLWSADYVML